MKKINYLLALLFLAGNFSLAKAQISCGTYSNNSQKRISTNECNNQYPAVEYKFTDCTVYYYYENTTSDISVASQKSAITQAFTMWTEYTSINFVETTNSALAKIFIKFITGYDCHGPHVMNCPNPLSPPPFDGLPWDCSINAHAFAQNGPAAGRIHFNDNLTWANSNLATYNYQACQSGQTIDLVTVAAHEIGHTLGLGHITADINALMYHIYVGPHRFLDEEDICYARVAYPGIVGTEYIVNPTNYSYSIPGGTYYNWTTTGPIAIQSGNGTSMVSVAPTAGSGVGKLCVYPNPGADPAPCSKCKSLYKSPPPSPVYAYAPTCIVKNTILAFAVTPAVGATSYSWSYTGPSGGLIFNPPGNANITDKSTHWYIKANTVGTYNICVKSIGYAGGSTNTCITVNVVSSIGDCSGGPGRINPLSGQSMEVVDFTLFPNPSSGQMQLNYSLDKTQQGELIIFDVEGKEVSHYTLDSGENNSMTLDESKLSTGIYFYRIVVDGEVVQSDKLSIVR